MSSQIVSQKILANGSTVYGQIVTVSEDTYNPPLPGAGEKTISVSVSGTRDHAPFAAGFRNVSDTKRFLHSIGEETFTVYTRDGEERKEVRTGLGIPTGMVSQFGADGPEFFVQESESGEAVPTVSEPGRNQSAIVVTTREAQRIGEQDAQTAKDSKGKPSKDSVPNEQENANAPA